MSEVPSLRWSTFGTKSAFAVAIPFVALVAVVFAWPKVLQHVFSSDYLPHLYCYLGKPGLVWSHVVSDSLIGLSYLLISATLTYLVWRSRRDIPFHWIVLAFGVFIVACGATHVMEVITIWVPVYVLSAVVKAITAIASVATAIVLIVRMPDILSLVRSAREAAEMTMKLRRSESRLQAITSTAADGIISSDCDGNVLTYNASAKAIFGYSPEEMIGRQLSSLIPDFPEAATKNSSIGDGQHVILGRSLDLPGNSKDGSKIPLSVSLSAWKSGGEVFCTSIIRDMTERNRWEQKLRGLLDAAPDATIVTDETGMIVQVNRQVERVFGYSWQELVGEPIEVLVPERFRVQHVGDRTQFLGNPRVRPVSPDLDLYGLHKDGHEFPVEISLSPLQTEDGVLVSSAIRDVTERKQAQDEMKKLNRELQRSNAELKVLNSELESFSYSVSHDLRAPLRAIDGFSQALLEDCNHKLSEQEVGYLDRIRAGAKRMGQLIDDLLTLARTARRELVREEVDLSILAQEICAQLRSASPGRIVATTIAPGLSAEGDRILLRQMLENLLSNAWKFTSQRDHSNIDFGLEVDGEKRVFFVRDNGVGFDMRYADKLFGAFQRLHDEREFAGNGIGLATVQRIIHRHGGQIWAEAEVGKGTTFRFTLNPASAGVGRAAMHVGEHN